MVLQRIVVTHDINVISSKLIYIYNTSFTCIHDSPWFSPSARKVMISPENMSRFLEPAIKTAFLTQYQYKEMPTLTTHVLNPLLQAQASMTLCTMDFSAVMFDDKIKANLTNKKRYLRSKYIHYPGWSTEHIHSCIANKKQTPRQDSDIIFNAQYT